MADLQQLIQRLADPKQGREAFKQLQEQGAAAVEALMAAFESPQDAIRRQAITLAASTKDTRVIEALIKLTTHPDAATRSAAIAGLGHFGGQARVREYLMQMARGTGDLHQRSGAVFALARTGEVEAAHGLWLEMLNDPAADIVNNAASQLGSSKRADAVEALIATLQRVGEGHIAFGTIVMALGNLKDQRAFEPIAAYLRSSNPVKRSAAAHALGQLGDARALELLEGLLKDKTVVGYEDRGGPSYTVADTAKLAIEALRKARNPDVPTTKAHDKPAVKPRWKFW
ncbi:MAG: HEAT repeat domain-containing protein [Anaerolineae bacterium]|nr:HEAT repeat domain-containing protein [Anaerolineae bacterium]